MNFSLFMAKFVTTIAMHLAIYPLFMNGMNIMKYVNNHPSRFDFQNTAFWLGAGQIIASYLFEVMNALILFTRVNVYFTVVSYVTVDVIANFGTFYYNSIRSDHNNVLFDVFQDHRKPRVVNHRRNMKWSEASCNLRFQRLVFKILRGIFIASCYYFIPFLFLYYHQVLIIIQSLKEESQLEW